MNATIQNKMSHMKLHGMLRSYQTMLDSNQHHKLTSDELLNILIQSEWEDRENKKISRHLRLAKFRYGATIEELNFTSVRGLDKTQVLRLADMSFINKREHISNRCNWSRKIIFFIGTRPPGLPIGLQNFIL